MLYGRVSAGFKYIEKANYISFYVSLGISYGIAHARLGCKIYHNARTISLEGIVYKLSVSYIAFNKYKLRL